MSEEKYKEPKYTTLEKINNIEIRQYNEYIIAKTSIPINQNKSDNNMFRTLASYIFGNNERNENIPMTAPVTSFKDDNTYNMMFYMLDAKSIDELPLSLNNNIIFETLNLDKCAVISFSWFVNDKKINNYQNKLQNFIEENGYIKSSPFMLNRYDPPWTLPFLRRNEIIVQIQ
tara:strand:+ start:17319 stop:17837 length:519 start_codon:yes stop_codon:yes gene_type:complete